jgi:hypothetical protein
MGSGYIATSNIIFDPYIWCTVHPQKSGNFQHAHIIFFWGVPSKISRGNPLTHRITTQFWDFQSIDGTTLPKMGPSMEPCCRRTKHAHQKKCFVKVPTYSNISFLTSNCLLSVVLSSATLVWKLQGPGSSQGYQPHDPMSPK